MERVIKKVSEETNKYRSILKDRLLKYSKKVSLFTYYDPLSDIVFAPLREDEISHYIGETRLIVLDEITLTLSLDEVFNILLHEFAHHINYCDNRSTEHDENFKEIAKILQVDEKYEKIKLNKKRHYKLLNKVKKLTALTQSPYEEEAQSALLKVKELTNKYTLDISRESDKNSTYEVELFTTHQMTTKRIILV